MIEHLLEDANNISGDIISWRRKIHENPEILFDLPVTLSFVQEKLQEFGYTPQVVGRAGICATAGNSGKTILLRADMDALPMEEKSGLPFASKNGYAHTCGHDIHTAALLGAAKLLKKYENKLCGTVKLVFQPCEEGLYGMQDLLDNGILENPRPDAAFALHVTGNKTGLLGIQKGYAGASCTPFQITIKGVGCHGAAPHMGVDPINVAAHLIVSLQTINSREVAPDEMLVVTVGMIQGGNASNVISDSCSISGTIRASNELTSKFAAKRLLEISDSVAKTFRAQADVCMNVSVPPMINDPVLAEDICRYVDELIGSGTTWAIPPMTGSEDFSLLCSHIPSVLGWFGAGGPSGTPLSNHHPGIIFDEKAIPLMSSVYAYCAAKWLSEHALDN